MASWLIDHLSGYFDFIFLLSENEAVDFLDACEVPLPEFFHGEFANNFLAQSCESACSFNVDPGRVFDGCNVNRSHGLNTYR